MNIDYPSRLTIREWAVSDRPREKYMANGSQNVSDAELVAILLRTGTSKQSAVDVAKHLLASCNNRLNVLVEMSVPELMKVAGIGKVKAVTLHAAFELGRRRRSEVVESKRKITSTQDVIELMQRRLAETKHEEFWVVYLNHASEILQVKMISAGGKTSTVVDVQQIVKGALEIEATGVILCHNHPSGNLTPSKQDVSLTNQVRGAADLFNIKLLDHVIVCRDNGYSFLAEGML